MRVQNQSGVNRFFVHAEAAEDVPASGGKSNMAGKSTIFLNEGL